MAQHRILVDTGKCIGCGLCRQDCPANIIRIDNEKAVITEQDCMKCGHCMAICPSAAVSITGFDEPLLEFENRIVLEPQQLLQAIKTRRSIRQFKGQEIPPEIIAQIIEAGRFTPTAKNLQDISYLILHNKNESIERTAIRLFHKLLPFARLFMKDARRVSIDDHFFFKKAPVSIVILSKDKISGSLAASNMALMAEAHGLGVLYSGFFTIAANVGRKLRRSLGLKRGDKAVTTLVIGYPNVAYRRTAPREPAAVRTL